MIAVVGEDLASGIEQALSGLGPLLLSCEARGHRPNHTTAITNVISIGSVIDSTVEGVRMAATAQRGGIDQISYGDLYRRWERANWSATELDFTQDVADWHNEFSDFERQAALFNYALFFWGEDAVADTLSPFIDAAPREEQRYFLMTQQVDEARHAVFFNRFMHEVAGIGSGEVASGTAEIRPLLSWGFRKVFDRLDRMAAELRRDRSIPKLCQAVTLYHLVIEAGLAQPGQHMIATYLAERDILPAFRSGLENVASDEQRHIGFGVKLLSDLASSDSRAPVAVAAILREVTPWLAWVFAPPNWDERYLTVFGFSYDRLGESGATSLETKLRSAGLALDDLPGPQIQPTDLSPVERSRRGHALARAGITGPRQGPAKRDHETMAILFDQIRRSINPEHGLSTPITIQWDFADADPWHINIDNGKSTASPGRLADADLRFRVSYDDWVDVVGRRTTPKRLLLTRKLRPRGSLRLIAQLPRLFPGG